MSRALVTFGTGAHERLLRIALPTFREFADRHAYELVVADPNTSSGRPPSWLKVPLLYDLLRRHDEVLWLDADTVIVDTSEDFLVPADAWQAMVEHYMRPDRIPNLGVWVVRPPMRAVLMELWGMRQYINHIWWEQGAMLELLGYTTSKPVHLDASTDLFDRTCFMPAEWNWHDVDLDRGDRRRVMHAAGYPLSRRVTMMEGWASRRVRAAA